MTYDAVGYMTCRAVGASSCTNATPTGQALTYDQLGELATWQDASSAPTATGVYAPDNAGDVPVVIAAEVPDNEGTSVTNFAERLAWNVAHDPASRPRRRTPRGRASPGSSTTRRNGIPRHSTATMRRSAW